VRVTRTAEEKAFDLPLIERLEERLVFDGRETNCLRVSLLRALIEAASLAGDHDEARDLRAQLEDFNLRTRLRAAART
jgi:hypothetical protein